MGGASLACRTRQGRDCADRLQSRAVDKVHLTEAFDAERFRARRFSEVDAATLSLIEAQPERFFAYLPPDPGLRGADLVQALETELNRLWDGHEEYAYSLIENDTGRLLGHMSVHALAYKHDCCELAYWIREEAGGQGYVSEAVRAVERMLFGCGFHRIEIRCDTNNRPSAAVAERCGYTLDGTLRGHMRRADGSYRDSFVYGKLSAP